MIQQYDLVARGIWSYASLHKACSLLGSFRAHFLVIVVINEERLQPSVMGTSCKKRNPFSSSHLPVSIY